MSGVYYSPSIQKKRKDIDDAYTDEIALLESAIPPVQAKIDAAKDRYKEFCIKRQTIENHLK